MSACRSCGRPIRWVDTEAGRRMCLDAAPNADGNVVMVGGAAHVLTRAERPTGTRWMPHSATCPERGAVGPRRSR